MRQVSAEGSSRMAEAFTVSKMLSTINEVMAPVATETCASVSLKRKMDNGIMLDTSAKEIAYLDMKSKIKHTAQQVAPLDRSERLCWITDQRASAKVAFDRREFERAAECYIQALTALDFGKTDEEKREMQQQAQIPLTCNLAACMLMMEQWEKAKRICDQALALDPSCLRALHQRSKALTKLHKFDEARYG
jgi:tetratricopeptide (TPR) repeat protein